MKVPNIGLASHWQGQWRNVRRKVYCHSVNNTQTGQSLGDCSPQGGIVSRCNPLSCSEHYVFRWAVGCCWWARKWQVFQLSSSPPCYSRSSLHQARSACFTISSKVWDFVTHSKSKLTHTHCPRRTHSLSSFHKNNHIHCLWTRKNQKDLPSVERSGISRCGLRNSSL